MIKEKSSQIENGISLIINEYQNIINKIFSNNKEKEHIKSMNDDFNSHNKDDILYN